MSSPNNEPGLFEGLCFYLPIGLPSRNAIKRMIEQNGGGISRFERVPGVITLMQREKLTKRSARQLCLKFVYESVDNVAVLDTEPYMYVEQVEPAKSKRRRVLYSPEEDAKMLHFVSRPEYRNLNPMSLNCWKKAESIRVTAHSKDSMRERYRKHLALLTNEQKRKLLKLIPLADRVIDVQEAEKENTEESEEPPQPAASSSSSSSSRKKRSREAINNSGEAEEEVKVSEPRPSVSQKKRSIEVIISSEEEEEEEKGSEPAEKTAIEIDKDDNGPMEEEEKGEIVESIDDTEDEEEKASNVESDIMEAAAIVSFKTGQDKNSCVHALYYSSGDPNVAIEYLNGDNPKEIWYPFEDAELKEHLNVTQHDIRDIISDGGLAKVSTRHSNLEIYQRICFLRT